MKIESPTKCGCGLPVSTFNMFSEHAELCDFNHALRTCSRKTGMCAMRNLAMEAVLKA